MNTGGRSQVREITVAIDSITFSIRVYFQKMCALSDVAAPEFVSFDRDDGESAASVLVVLKRVTRRTVHRPGLDLRDTWPDLFPDLGPRESMNDDMDINAGCMIDGDATVEEVGAEIYNMGHAVASGRETISESLDYGEKEFVPQHIGTVM